MGWCKVLHGGEFWLRPVNWNRFEREFDGSDELGELPRAPRMLLSIRSMQQLVDADWGG